LDQAKVKLNTFRSRADEIGSLDKEPRLRFFASSGNTLAFGPGAGLVVAVSVGTSSLLAALVDANGDLSHQSAQPRQEDQLSAPPRVLLGRIRTAVADVLRSAFADPSKLVDGRLPLLGVAVAWPAAINRDKKPVSWALADSGWHTARTLVDHVALELNLEKERTHALNDANAAAIAVAFDRTRRPDHLQQTHPELTMVLRLAGGIGGATIVIEPPRDGRTGFLDSTLIGGKDHLAGELGHVAVSPAAVEALNAARDGLGSLEPHACSCVSRGEPVPPHLEAYAAVRAVTRRFAPDEPGSTLIERLRNAAPGSPEARALHDAGSLVGEALAGPVAWVNPAAIVLTGSLALAPVEAAIKERIFGSLVVSDPTMTCAKDSDYIRVRGAALAVLRTHVYRRLDTLLGGHKKTLPGAVASLTKPLAPGDLSV
jgi:predicted NBD/HSP70 family sugar kinase